MGERKGVSLDFTTKKKKKKKKKKNKKKKSLEVKFFRDLKHASHRKKKSIMTGMKLKEGGKNCGVGDIRTA